MKRGEARQTGGRAGGGPEQSNGVSSSTMWVVERNRVLPAPRIASEQRQTGDGGEDGSIDRLVDAKAVAAQFNLTFLPVTEGKIMRAMNASGEIRSLQRKR